MAQLSDTTALLDPMNRLRAVYPNVLALERTGLLTQQQNRPASTFNRPDHNEMAMFHDFYQQLQGKDLSAEQETLLRDIMRANTDHPAELTTRNPDSG